MQVRNQLIFLFFIFLNSLAFSQEVKFDEKKIEIIHADFTDYNEYELLGALVLTGNIQAQHDNMHLWCNKAYYYQAENYIKLFGNVRILQNDTLQLTSKYAEYNGLQKVAYASGNVLMTSPQSKMQTESVYYDRNTGIAHYNNNATITNKENTLKSKAGKYYTHELKYEFRTSVVLTNPTTKITTDHLDFYESSGHAYLFGPSHIHNENAYIYTENGFYDTKLNTGDMIKNNHILYDNKRIEADKLHYNKEKSYYKGVENVKVTDTVNKMIAKSHFAEVFRFPESDSVYMTKKPLIKALVEKDSAFIHAKDIYITGADKERKIKALKNVRMLREPNMSGRADTLLYNQKTGLMQLLGKPVTFRGLSQMTGKEIQLINNPVTEKLDSLKVLKDAFLIEKDTLGTGYNQAKGINLYGKFIEDKLTTVDLVQNAEMIYYIYDEGELEGVDKGICSRIFLEFEDQKIETATRFVNPSSTTYPPGQFPESEAKLPGFLWRGDERILTKEDIFPPDEDINKEENSESSTEGEKTTNDTGTSSQTDTKTNQKQNGKMSSNNLRQNLTTEQELDAVNPNQPMPVLEKTKNKQGKK